ncbi:hypothetical protein FIBSPDRAFT_961256 [Athelia psychrophila]|uniref:Uncharacterized protein n=1 Tax=Athelia psychrophila TaxID=1759441 RepID=A0A166BE15_9AGAM|nr:hypothetical protein FIBSPDRAFT_961256 [Fibularhizoctonia sp. CBS 109695]
MYNHLDTAPPQSQFRRPWSPEPFNPNPPSSNGHGEYNPYREPSDASVEALDLADYALSLSPQASRYPHPQFRPHDPYPSTPPPTRPLASRASINTPSLVSAGSLAYTASSRSAIHRPFSLPPPARSRTSLPGGASAFGHATSPIYPHIVATPFAQGPDPEIDIAQFPAWSRNWYDSNNLPPPASLYDGHVRLPNDLIEKPSPFDPGYSYPHPGSQQSHYNYPMSDESSRDLLPWSGEAGPPVDAGVKEERLRMLEHEFAEQGKGGKATAEGAEGDAGIVGSVDEKGQLITQGPRKRIAVRLLRGTLALASGATSIYAALIMKSTPAAPPAGKLPAYVLYVLSVATFLFMLYFFLFRPWCCSARPRSSAANLSGGMGMPGMPGMMVMPVSGGMGMKGKNGKKGKKGMGMGNDVQVNLIVDPGMFQAQQQDEDFDENASVPGSYSPYGAPQQNGAQRRTRPRRSVFAGLAMEEQWRAARRTLKFTMFFDVVCMVLWGAEFVLILMGKRCPSGSFGGWCNAYNVASACACLMCAASAVSILFDVKDLDASKVSPRTRP